MTVFTPPPFFLAAAAGQGEQRATIFFAQILLLVAVGRLLGEWMQRIGQPAVIGQLLAGIILGPSVFGTIWPAGETARLHPPPLRPLDHQRHTGEPRPVRLPS